MPWVPGETLLIRIWETLEKFGIGVLSPAQIIREGRARIQVRQEEAFLDAKVKERIAAPSDVTDPLVQYLPLQGFSSKMRLVSPREIKEKAVSVDRTDEGVAALLISIRRSSQLDEIEKITNMRAVHRLAETIAETGAEGSDAGRVDSGWLSQWRDGASRAEDENLRELWARLLVGEVSQPGSYSKRTIRTLVELGEDEAQLFSRLAPFCLHKSFPFDLISKELNGFDFRISVEDILALESAGLMSFVAEARETFSTTEQTGGLHLIIRLLGGRYFIEFGFRWPVSVLKKIAFLTASGIELKELGKLYPTVQHAQVVADHFFVSSMEKPDYAFFYMAEEKNGLIVREGEVTNLPINRISS